MPLEFLKKGESRSKNKANDDKSAALHRSTRTETGTAVPTFHRFPQQSLVSSNTHEEIDFENRSKGRKDIHAFERALYQRGYQRIAGVDEAGRGPLAGPVVASAVILPLDCAIVGIMDSKQLTAKQRDVLFDEIREAAVSIGISYMDSKTIDQVNILQATMQAMRESIEQIDPSPDYVIVDGTHIPAVSIPTKAIPKGDSLSQSVAAASIIAKVTRDRLMIELDKVYPQYGFRQHKGYGTDQHRQALIQFGPCPIHRRTFRPVSELSEH